MKYFQVPINVATSGKSDYEAMLTGYIPDNIMQEQKERMRPAVLILPGGGYEYTSDREAEPIALKFMAQGFNAIVLRYSIAPTRYPNALLELAETVNYVREKEVEWNVNKEKVIVCGFSAGGHLAGSLGVLWNSEFIDMHLGIEAESIKPNGMILCYPVITSGEFAHSGSFDNLLGEKEKEIRREELSLEKLVSKDTPKTFLWHTFNDGTVPVKNSLLFSNALAEQSIPFELHIYPNGVHGLGLCEDSTATNGKSEHIDEHVASWFKLACEWINNL